MIYTNVESVIIMNIIIIRRFFKRITDNANLSENEKYVYKLKKTQRIS